MCVYSMIADSFFDKWNKPWKWVDPNTAPQVPWVQPCDPIPYYPDIPVSPSIKKKKKELTQEQIDDLLDLLKRAKEYDKRNNEPDCELEEKKEKIRKLAKELGYEGEIEFP